MKYSAKIKCALLLFIMLVSYSSKAQSPNTTIDSFDSFMSIKLGTNKKDIKDTLTRNYAEKNMFRLEKDSLGYFFGSKVTKCFMFFDNKDVLTKIVLHFYGFDYSPVQDTVQKRVDLLYNRIKTNSGEYTKLKKSKDYFKYSWIGKAVKLDYEVDLVSDGKGAIYGASGVYFARKITLTQAN